MSEPATSTKAHSNGSVQPLVSVVTPVFNGGKYLSDTIESILNQTFRDFEFILLDDGSTDDSLAILREYAAKDSRIRVITRENRGLGTTQHELVYLAQGEFIAQLDHDDIAFPDRLELQVDFLRKNPEVAVVGGAYQLIDSGDRYLTTLTLPQTNEEIQTLMLGGHCAIGHFGAMMRRAQMLEIGSYDSSLNSAADIDLFLRLGEVGELANLSDVLMKYRLHDKSASVKVGLKQREEARKACESAWQRRNITGVFSAQHSWRPGSDRASRHEFMLKYGWWAWNSCQRKTAAFYGCQAIKVKPSSIAAWKLLIVSLIKPLIKSEKG